MKISAKKRVTVDVEYDVDNGILEESSTRYKIADIILNGALDACIKDLYSEECSRVENAVRAINNVFAQVDKILELTLFV